MSIRRMRTEDIDRYVRLRVALWPGTTEMRHRTEIAAMLAKPEENAVFVCEEDGVLLGFAEVSQRKWAEGCLSSPVGYLEGWYVAEAARRRGIGRALARACEAWAIERGCTEMASDTDLGNTVSEAAHARLGYTEAGRVIAFRKYLPGPESTPLDA